LDISFHTFHPICTCDIIHPAGPGHPIDPQLRSAPAEMRTALRTGALRGLRPSTSATLRLDANNVRSRTTRRLPVVSSSGFHSKSQDCSEALGTAAKLPEAEPVPPAAPRERITLADIKERRAKAGRLIAPTASYSDADMFKAPVGSPNPLPLDPFSRLFTVKLDIPAANPCYLVATDSRQAESQTLGP
jgi:hypothetical protein